MPQSGTMNFFQHQEVARKKTGRLIMLFTLAVTLICLALYAVTQTLVYFISLKSTTAGKPAIPFHYWEPKTFFMVVGATAGFILLLSLYKVLVLRSGGGTKIAQMMGGEMIPLDTDDPLERRLNNVVEEMAIASGMAVPIVFVLQRETGINAFAAGYDQSDAVIAVTRGALEHLNRDELQGIVAHEFSHIINGDMSLNLKLMGVLFGILAIGIIGQHVAGGTFRGIAYSSGRRSRSNNSGGGGAIYVVLVALAVMAIGYIGTFIGRIIQAAVSRQREFLADSSAVQFTRNPNGIGSALKKIGGIAAGSKIQAASAGQANHMFFGDTGTIKFFTGLLASHPPLGERVRRVLPQWDGEFPESSFGQKLPPVTQKGPVMTAAFAGQAQSSPQPIPQAIPIAQVAPEPENILSSIGTLSENNLILGAELLDKIPDKIHEELSDPISARLAIYALLLDENQGLAKVQVGSLTGSVHGEAREKLWEYRQAILEMDKRARLPLLDIAMPALQSMNYGEIHQFTKDVDVLIMTDNEVTLFEFTIQWLLNFRLHRTKAGKGRVAYNNIRPLKANLVYLLTLLALEGNEDQEQAHKAFYTGTSRVKELSIAGPPKFNPNVKPSFGDLSYALNRMALASYAVKERIIEACAYCTLADRKVTIEEADLLRVISAGLNCPLPPFMTGNV